MFQLKILLLSSLLLGIVKCQGRYGTFQHQSPCNSPLVLIDKRCQCPFPDLQYFNARTNECISEVGSPCLEIVDGVSTGFKCAENSKCTNSKGYYECTCVDGFVQDGATCMPGYGTTCTGTCSSSSSLACWNGSCRCGSLRVYDKVLDKCVGRVGARCWPDQSCVDGAVCKLSYFRERARCECKVGYKTTSDRMCTDGQIIEYGNTNSFP